jgi:hypothetical protein
LRYEIVPVLQNLTDEGFNRAEQLRTALVHSLNIAQQLLFPLGKPLTALEILREIGYFDGSGAVH